MLARDNGIANQRSGTGSLPRGIWSPRVQTLSASIALLLLVTLLATYWRISAQERSNGGLYVADSDLDLGAVPEQRHFQWSITFHNRSPGTIVVDDVQPSCSCTDIAPRNFILPPGKAQTINLTIDLTKAAMGVPVGGAGAFTEDLRLRSTRLTNLQSGWTLRGNVRRQAAVSPGILKWDGVPFSEPQNEGDENEFVRAVTIRTGAIRSIPEKWGERGLLIGLHRPGVEKRS